MNLSFQDAMRVVGAALLSIGGGGVVVVALSSWLGKIWAQRLMQKDIAKHSADLEELKSKLEGMNKKVQAKLDKTVYVNRVQFETEFKALTDIWNRVSTVRQALAGLQVIPPEQDEDLVWMDEFERKFEKFATASGELRQAAHNQSPFYPREIYDEIRRMIDTLTAEEAELKQMDDPRSIAAWVKWGDRNWPLVLNAANRISEMIRERIESLSLYRE